MPTFTTPILLTKRRNIPANVRFWARTQLSDNGCITWTGRVDRYGYGRFTELVGGKVRPTLAHRLAWTFSGHELVEGMSLDHLCHTNDLSCSGGTQCAHRRCVNPDHLEQVSPAENHRRGRGATIDPLSMRCGNGHVLRPDIRLARINGKYVQCNFCVLENQRAYRARLARQLAVTA